MIKKDDTILVTGGTGFIGSYILRLLVASGYTRIRALCRPTSRFDLVESVRDRIDWKNGDLLDFFSLEEALQGVDAVIHAAALVSFHAADRERLYEVNVTGTANLVNLSLDAGIRRFIHISSVAAMGRSANSRIIDEDVEWQHSSHNSNYGRSKHLAEMEVWRAHVEGLPVAILNPANVMGSGFWEEGTARAIRQIWNGFPFYTEGRTGYVDVRDVARLARRLLESEINGRRFIASENNYTYRQIFDWIAEGLEKRPPRIRVRSWMLPLARMGDWLRSRLQGRRPFLTREIVRNSRNQWEYRNERSRRELDFTYYPVHKTVLETTDQFRESVAADRTAAYLPFTSPTNA